MNNMSHTRSHSSFASMSTAPPASPRKPSSRSIATVESNITKLLMATKHLLQKLTQWSKGLATETDVSDVYVQLGNDFKLVTKTFASTKIPIDDLGDVPFMLRQVLEVALRQQPSEQTLDQYLPQIREIIVSLLDKLKVKQAMLKALKSESNASPKKEKTQLAVEPAPKQRNSAPAAGSDALSQLKRGDTLQRRASKRFSAYQYAKLTNPASGKQEDLPREVNGRLATPVIHPASTMEDPTSASSNQRPLSFQEEGDTVVFLKLRNKVKKCKVALPLTFNSIRLLFVEKFTYSPGSKPFPEIYIQDPDFHVAYELEESNLPNIKEGAVLVLQDESEEEALRKEIGQLKTEISQNHTKMLSEIRDQLSNISISSAAPSVSSSGVPTSPTESSSLPSVSLKELSAIKHEIVVVKQIQSKAKQNFKESVSHVLEKVKEFQSLSFNASKSANRVYMEKSHSKLSEDSDGLLTKVDDLQDIIEDLRKDVATRGSRPQKKKLDSILADIQAANDKLESMTKYMQVEKPNWKKIWESELDTVCEEQQFLSLQEDLVFDLKEDLSKVTETFELVKQCCEEQEKNPKKRTAHLPIAKPGTFNTIREAMLVEVNNLNPDHESRVEAIERAERIRERERDLNMKNEFQEELGQFVEQSQLKSSGGIEEVEKQRQLRDEENLRANFGGYL